MKRLICSLGALLLSAPLLAAAAEGWVVADIDLQAGPASDYPYIDQLEAGSPVAIHGCLSDWSWCDVTAYDYDERGWVPATFLEQDYRSGPVFIAEYGARIGIPVISFSIGTYWDRYYHHRPFYAQRHHWESRRIGHHAPPRPARIVATRPEHHSGEHHRRAQAATTTTMERSQPAPTRHQRESRTAEQNQASGGTSRREHRPSDSAPQMTPREAPQPAPRQAPQSTPPQEPPRSEPPHEHPMAEHRQNVPHGQQQATRQHEPKPKDELKKPGKRHGKDDNKDDDNGGGRH